MTKQGGLVQLGWTEDVLELLEKTGAQALKNGAEPARVLRVDRGEADVMTDTGELRATMTKAAKDCVAGDWVAVERAEQRVVAVSPRRTAFVRRSARGGRTPQTLAANMDTVMICQGLRPGVNIRRLERELVLAFDSGADPIVVLTKADLASQSEIDEALAEVRTATDAPTFVVSNTEGTGIEELRTALPVGRTFALIGSSGVGKSSIVNAMSGSSLQAIGEVRSGDEKGRHTTTAAILLILPDGRLLLDTPGVRALALWQPVEGLALAFADITEAAQSCRFDDCRHEQEPGCEVTAARVDGRIDAERFESWMRMRAEIIQLTDDIEEQRQKTPSQRSSTATRPKRRKR